MKYNFKTVQDAYSETRKYCVDDAKAQFPPYVTFELVNKCNFKCVMCPVTYTEGSRKELDFELFKKAIDEISQYGSAIRFIGYDEPLLYPQIKEAIKYVKEKKLLLHITTNASLLNNNNLYKTFVEEGVDSVIISMQGLSKEEYCSMRQLSDKTYSEVISNIKKLYDYRVTNKPYIKITSTITQRDSHSDAKEFAKIHLDYVDEVQITGWTHFVAIKEQYGQENIMNEMQVKAPTFKAHTPCYVPNYEMIIKSDGNIMPCCNTTTSSLLIGKTGENSLMEAWDSKKALSIRKDTNSSDLSKHEDCNHCQIRYEEPEHGHNISGLFEGKVFKTFTKHNI